MTHIIFIKLAQDKGPFCHVRSCLSGGCGDMAGFTLLTVSSIDTDADREWLLLAFDVMGTPGLLDVKH